ncbi:unnamed protein product [Camellia sinensis]
MSQKVKYPNTGVWPQYIYHWVFGRWTSTYTKASYKLSILHRRRQSILPFNNAKWKLKPVLRRKFSRITFVKPAVSALGSEIIQYLFVRREDFNPRVWSMIVFFVVLVVVILMSTVKDFISYNVGYLKWCHSARYNCIW